jgi:hypothetical protein
MERNVYRGRDIPVAATENHIVFWDMTPYNLVSLDMFHSNPLPPPPSSGAEDGICSFLQNIGNYLPEYMVSHHERQLFVFKIF